MTAENDNYAVETKAGCFVVYGSITLDAMREIVKQVGENARVDRDAAAELGADMVIGNEDSLARLQHELFNEKIAL